MPTRLFVDTLFVIALLNPRDKYHQQASLLADRYEHAQFLTTDVVLIEIADGLARNFKPQAITIIEQFRASPDVKIVHLTADRYERAFTLYRQYQDKQWGLTDCLSFITMREEGVDQALTFDQHFVQAGLQALMRQEP